MESADYFAGWSPDAIDAWLAGAFEHAGELDVCATSVVLTFKGDAQVMRALQRRFGFGEVTDRLEPRVVSLWRISHPNDVRPTILTMEPFLTSTREAVRQGRQQLDQIAVKEQQRRERDREIVALWMEGRSKNAIAQALNITYSVVTKAIARFKGEPAADRPRQGRKHIHA
jgi:DNA-binding CsgD family transcriptional regulator